jgi:transposase
MAMGKRRKQEQPAFWLPTEQVVKSPGHPFYNRLNKLLDEHGFDAYVEDLCREYYHESLGRPGVPPAVYFRMLLIGYFEGIDSERGIDWRCGDSLTLREFLGYALTESTPDHSTLCTTRQRIDLETHIDVFNFVLGLLADHGLLKGEQIGVDATTLEANAAMRSIVRNDTGQSYQDFLIELAKASGIETPTREDLAKLDKARKKKASNKDWHNPHDPDAKITKMKDGRTHLAHKAEHAVDQDTQAIVAVTLQAADEGDTTTLWRTLDAADYNLRQADEDRENLDNEKMLREVVADKGYHSNDVMTGLAERGIRSYVSEPDRGRRKWTDEKTGTVKAVERDAVYANRRRVRGKRGKALMRKRGEVLERPFAHCYETGGMRRTHLRGGENILKRLLVHVAGYNLGLVMRKVFGLGKPRCAQDGLAGLLHAFLHAIRDLPWPVARLWPPRAGLDNSIHQNPPRIAIPAAA